MSPVSRVSNLSSFPVDRNSKISITIIERGGWASRDKGEETTDFSVSKSRTPSQLEGSLEVKSGVLPRLFTVLFAGFHLGWKMHTHVGGSWDKPNTDSEPGKSRWLAKGNPEEMTHKGDLNYHEGETLSECTCVVAETSTGETKHHTRRVGEFRFIMLAGPEELTLQALSPKQRGYRDFIHAGMIKQVCKEQDKGEWDKLQFLVLWVPTFWDFMTYMIQTLQEASWVTETGAGGYVKF